MSNFIVKKGQFQFICNPARFCCGLQEIGNLHFSVDVPYNTAVDVDKDEVARIKEALVDWPATYATTAEDDGLHQFAAAEVLRAVGFTEAGSFSGRGGNLVKMWFYENEDFYRESEEDDDNDD